MTPRSLFGGLSRRFNRVVPEYVEGFVSWSEATKASKGYSSHEILETVLSASLRVQRGEAVSERDGVLLPTVEYSWPVISALLWSAASNGGRLSVCDIGGSLGTNYRQAYEFTRCLTELRWHVVEQEHFSEAGNRHFRTSELQFVRSVSELGSEIDVSLFSGSLQYLPDPLDFVDSVSASDCRRIVVDRTPFIQSEEDIIAVQHVPKHIYDASYAVRLFSEEKLISSMLRRGWRQQSSFQSLDRSQLTSAHRRIKFKGFIFERV